MKFQLKHKKAISIFLLATMLACIFLMPASAQESEYSASDADFQVYNVKTGETTYHEFSEVPEAQGNYSPGYYPNGTASLKTDSPSAIVGTDDRTRVTDTTVGPYCNTVYVYSTFSDGSAGWGSGFMIGPSAIATAAHCVYNGTTTATSVTVIPAKNGSTWPYGSTTAKNIIVSSNYVSGSANHDWAVVELNSALGNRTGWLGLKYQGSSYTGVQVYNTGYPSQSTTVGQASDPYMFVASGYVRSSGTYTLDGDWDASAGNSGGPVFTYYSDAGYTAIGILTTGSPTDGPSYPTYYSTATRITQDMFNLFVTYRS